MKYNRKKPAKPLALIISLVLIFSIAVGGTLAYLIAERKSVENTFEAGTVIATILDNNTIRNDGNTAAWIRVAVVGNWAGAANTVYGMPPALTVTADDWLLGTDGYYYWPTPVAPGASTGAITASTSEPAPDGYQFAYTLGVEAIQSAPAAAFAEWNAQGVAISDGVLVKVN